MLTLTTINRDEALDLLLRGALARRAEIDATLRDLRAQLNGDNPPIPARELTWPEIAREELKTIAQRLPKRRKFSAAARKRMSAAQRARWAKA